MGHQQRLRNALEAFLKTGQPVLTKGNPVGEEGQNVGIMLNPWSITRRRLNALLQSLKSRSNAGKILGRVQIRLGQVVQQSLDGRRQRVGRRGLIIATNGKVEERQ